MNVRIKEESLFFGDNGMLAGQNGLGIDYEARILRSLRKIIRSVDVYSRNLNNKFGITTPQMVCLHIIGSDGPMTLSSLSGKANLSVSTVNGIVDRLVAKKFISRVRSRKDRRQVVIKILEAGEKIVKSVPSLLQDKLASSLGKLGELEQVSIALSLERVVELMEAEDVEVSPRLIENWNLNEEIKRS